jgi:hypothetical protein
MLNVAPVNLLETSIILTHLGERILVRKPLTEKYLRRNEEEVNVRLNAERLNFKNGRYLELIQDPSC